MMCNKGPQLNMNQGPQSVEIWFHFDFKSCFSLGQCQSHIKCTLMQCCKASTHANFIPMFLVLVFFEVWKVCFLSAYQLLDP